MGYDYVPPQPPKRMKPTVRLSPICYASTGWFGEGYEETGPELYCEYCGGVTAQGDSCVHCGAPRT